MSASKAFAFSLALLLGAGNASAQGVVYDEPIDGSDSSGSISGSAPIGSAGGYFWAQGDFGERPAVEGNFASIGAFAPIDFLGSDRQFFIDGQMMINDNTEMGLNAGLGYRQLFDSIGIVGANAFYTLDQSQNDFSYQRASFGAEWLTDYFQVTGNLYVPFDSSQNNVGPVILTKDALFLNNNLVFQNIQNAETPLKGADLEIGVPIPGMDWLSVHGGAYVWDGKNSEEIKGTRGRVQADLTNVLLNLSLSKDDHFGSQVNFAATYFFGSQMASYAPRSKDIYDRMNDRVRRSSRIETRQIVVRPLELAINPDTGLAYTFTHVQNNAAGGGDGSTEARLNNLGLATGTGADIILVHRGTSTAGAPLTAGAGLVLADNQKVFGEGCPTFIDVANRPGAPCPLPGWATTGTNPFVGGGAGVNIITLADNNTVSGLNMITGAGGNAIAGNGIVDFTLTKLNRDIVPPATTGAGGGIALNNATGTGVIDDFGFNIPGVVGPNGIAITNTNSAPLNVQITNGRYLNGGENGIVLSSNNSDISATINNVNNSGSGTGLRLQATNTGDVFATVTNSHFDNAVNDGINMVANNGDARLDIANSSANEAGRDGVHVVLANGGQGTINANVLDISGADDDAIFSDLNDSLFNLNAVAVDGSGAGDDGYDFRLAADSTLNAGITNSNLSGATDDGIFGTVAGGSEAFLDINNTSLANAGGEGLFVTTSGTSQFMGSLEDSSLDSAGGNGVQLVTTGTSRSLLTLDNSDATNAGLNGLLVNTQGNSRTDLVLVDQGFDNAGQDAINLTSTTDSLILGTGNNVSGANAGDDGIQLTANDGRIGLNFDNTGSFAGATDDGINFFGVNDSNISLDIAGAPSSFNGAGGDGVDGTLTDSRGLLILTDVTFQGAGGEGLGVTATNSTFNGSVTNGSFNDAGSNGTRLTLSNSTGNLTLNNTDVENAGGDALVVNATNGSASDVMLLNGISLNGATDDAIDVVATDSSVLVQGSGVSGANAGDDAIHLEANASEIGLLLTNAGSFTSPGGDGIEFIGTNASNLVIQVQGFPLSSFDNAGANGVIGTLTGASEATLALVNTSFDNATLEGFGVTATDSTFNGAVMNGSFEDAGGNAVRLTLDNSEGNLTLDNVDASGAGGSGLTVTADNASTSMVGLLNGVSLDDDGADAIALNANAGSTILAGGNGVSGANAGDNGIDLDATNNSVVALNLTQSGSFFNPGSDAISLLSNNGSGVILEVSGINPNFNSAGGDGVDATVTNNSFTQLTLNNATFNDAGGDGLRATVATNSMFRGDLTNVALNRAAGDAIELSADTNSLIELVGSGLSGADAAADGLNIDATNASRVDVNLSANGSFASAGDDGIDFNGTGGSSVNVIIAGAPSSFDDAADNGVIGTLTNSAGTLNLTNTTFRNAGTDGLHLDLTSSTLTGSIVGSDFSRPGPAPSGDDGLELLLDNSMMTLNFTGSPVDNAGDDAIHIEAINGSLLNTKFTGGSLVNAGGDMTDITFAGGSVVNFNLDPVATGANQNGLRFTGTTGGILNARISDSPMSVPGDVVGQNGVLGSLNAATANLRLVNSDISNATLDGINVNAQNGSVFNATITNSQVSNAGGDGLDLTLVDSQSSVVFDNSDLNNAGGDGIRVNGDGSTFRLNLSNGINIDDATGDAMEFIASDSTFNVFGNAGVTANNAGGDGLRVNATNGAVVNGVFNDLDLDEATGNAIDLAAVGSSINIQGRGLTTGFSAGGDAIRMAGQDSTVALQLFNAGSFANAGGNGVFLDGNNSQMGLRFSGASPGAANLSGANDHGIVANLTNNSVGQFIVDDFQIQNSGLSGISLGLNSSQIVSSTFTNGQVDNNGQDGVAGNRNGLRIVADNGSNIGTRAGQVPGLIFNTVSFQNDVVNPRPQENGVNASIDGDSFVGVSMLNGAITRNDGNGVQVAINPDASVGDTSFTVFNYENYLINNNWGDGFNVVATNGADDVTPPQLTGAIFNILNSEINNNGNFINAPATGVVGDGRGDGIDATATGDNSVAGNTQVTFNLNGTDILGNEEAALNSAITGGGSVNFNLTGGSIDGGINVPCADGPLAFVEFTLNGTQVSSSAQLILCAKNGGTLNANVGNVDFSNNAGQGIILLAESGGDINANLFHIDMTGNGTNPLAPINPDVNPPITTVTGAIQGLVTGAGSTIDLTLDEMVVTGNRQSGLDLSVENGGVLTAAITNSNFSDNGAAGVFDGIRIDVDGAGSAATVGLTDVKAHNATDDGLDFETTNGGQFDLTMESVFSRNAAADGFSFTLDNSTGSIDSNGLDIDDADGRAVNIVADNGSTLDVTNFDHVVGRNAGEEGMNLDILNGSTLTNFNSETLNFADSGRLNPTANGIDILVNNGSTTPVIVLNDVNADNAGGSGLLLTATDPTVTLDGVTVDGASFANAGNTGVEINIANQSTPTTVQLTGVNASDAGNYGVQLNINGVTGGTSDILLSNVRANNAAGNDGLEINVDGLLATDRTRIAISNGSSFNNAADKGVDLNLDGAAGSVAEVIFSGVSANDATNDGINITPTSGLDLFVGDFRNVSATNAGDEGLEVIANTPSGLRLFNANTVDVSGAAGDGVLLSATGPQSGPAVISFDGLNANDAGGTGVNIDLNAVPGASTINLANTTAMGALTGDGVNITAQMANAGDSTAITINTLDVTDADVDGLHIDLIGNGTPGDTNGSITLDGLTATNATEDGIDIGLDQGVTATVAQFDNVTANGNGENGLLLDVTDGSVLTSFTADMLNLSNNGTLGAGFDGLDVRVQGAGSSATMDLSNLTVNNSGGRGIDLDVFDGAALTFNLTTATVNQSGLNGIDLNVGSQDEFGTPPVASATGTFTGTWTGVSVNSSGRTTTSGHPGDGINVDVDGAGSTADLTLDAVTSNTNDGAGIDIRVDSAATGTFEVNNGTTANTNATVGFLLAADGLGTMVDLTSLAGGATNVFNGNLGGPGVDINLTDRAVATNLNMAASASGNAGDGVRVLANDGTPVTINNFGISGTALQVNNNQGSGLFIDFFNVQGVNDFELQNISVSGNMDDQIFAQFRGMTLDHVTLDTVTTTGAVGSDDGVEISLIDTALTNANYGFELRNVVSTNNGDDGLVLTLSETPPVNNITTSSLNNGLILGSEFARNGGQGVQLSFSGDSTASFDIIDNTAGFHDNGAEGILIEVLDGAEFAISGTNLENGNQSMSNNLITNNGGIGFHVVASEPSDTTTGAADGFGPRVDLELGDATGLENTITSNRDAAIAIEMAGDAKGSFSIVNSTLTQTLNGPSTTFNGDGLAFVLSNFAELESLTIDGATSGLNISNNAGSGLVTRVNNDSSLGTITNLTVLNTTIESNGLHGIDIQRSGDGVYGINNQVIIGQFGAGNTIQNNTGNGLNVIFSGGTNPFGMDVTGNEFTNNTDGIFLNGTSDAVFVGNISDNTFDSNNRDSVHVVLENNAALGDASDLGPNNEFLMAGNQILNSERHGIFFDTNSTNESGAVSGGAYVNVLIQDSLNDVDGFGNAIRTLISGSGLDGIHIEDNSDFLGSVATATIQNTYSIQASDILNNGRDGISIQQAVIGVAIGGNTGIAVNIGDATAPDQRDVVIQGNGDDGLDIVIRDSTNIGSILNVLNTTIQLNGATGDGEGGNGVEVDLNNFAVFAANFDTVDILMNEGDGMDWGMTSFRDPSAGIMNDVSMLGVNSSNNRGVGLHILSTHDRGNATPNESVWNIGNANSLTTADVNRFNNNGQQGILFDQQATQLSQATVNGPDAVGTLTDNNSDVYVETNLPFIGSPNYAPSTNHGVVSGGTIGALPAPITRLETDIHLVDTFNLINSEVANNGSTNNGDGLVLGIGSLTRMNATISGNSFGGNTGDDIRIYPQRSSGLNPPNSRNNNPVGLAGSGNLPQNFLVYDPVAYLDLVFGAIDTDLDGTPETVLGNGGAATSGTGGVGVGQQISINSFGSANSTSVTTTGLYDNNDLAKGNLRPVVLAGQVQVFGPNGFDDQTVNNFIELGVQQDIGVQFQFFNQNAASPYPDATLP